METFRPFVRTVLVAGGSQEIQLIHYLFIKYKGTCDSAHQDNLFYLFKEIPVPLIGASQVCQGTRGKNRQLPRMAVRHFRQKPAASLW